MIIAHINGGLGNQLFQYAAGKPLASKHNTVLKLDVRDLSTQMQRSFSLSSFQGTDVIFATQEEIEQLRKPGLFFKVSNRLKPASSKSFFRETSFQYHQNFQLLKDDVYIKGYWQSEQYFDSIKASIKAAFQLKESYIGKVKQLIPELSSNQSVALHIRRGDYVNKETIEMHGLLPFSYYEKAIAKISAETEAPHFNIFSDDVEWVRTYFPLPEKATLVSGILSFSPYEDLYLMSQCKHNIIANSSFSWWGAWMNRNEKKIVIAPDQWFVKNNEESRDIVPADWIRL